MADENSGIALASVPTSDTSSKTLKLVFATDTGDETTLSISKPNESLTASGITAQTAAIIAIGVTSGGAAYASYKGAYYETTSKTVIA